VGDFTIAKMDKHIGQELGVSDWVIIDQSRIDTFASCTGDQQWIHVDAERAQRESPYGGPVAHGYLTLLPATSRSSTPPIDNAQQRRRHKALMRNTAASCFLSTRVGDCVPTQILLVAYAAVGRSSFISS